MNNIEISLRGIENSPECSTRRTMHTPEEIEFFILNVLDKLGKQNWNLSVLFCNNAVIQELNKQYRNLDEPTDVLSFIMGETAGERYMAGDIAISLEMAEENARCFGIFIDDELRRLLIHGILHLSGMDHKSNDKDEPMLILQEKILAELHTGIKHKEHV